MNTPLGRAAGNWLEVKESVACLENKGPDDLRELTVEFAAQLLAQTKSCADLQTARDKVNDILKSGAPRRKWDEMLLAQGTDLDAFHRRLKQDSSARKIVELKADRSGFVSRCDARIVGEVVRDLGGGRLHKESIVDFDVGIDQIHKPGEQIKSGEILARIHAVDVGAAENARQKLAAAFTISDKSPPLPPLIMETV
jgi:thymidine phosphorylase